MPKRKLTPEKKVTLRMELKEKIAAGLKSPDILSELSKKYGVSTETIRWYVKNQSSKGRARLAKRGKSSRKATRRRSAKTRHASVNGHTNGLPKVLERLSLGSLEKLVLAKKLLPALEASRRRELALREEIRIASRDLRTLGRKTRKIERRIKTLARG